MNKGTNSAYLTDPADVRSRDLDGRTRVRYGTVDMGAYELIYRGMIFKAR